ncbi:MAG: rhodanese-like domain-containing protein [Verrucomicrobia bacterium]|nr:rhodanese-like domain-containing protein [Verrucomicrobiota bacterium]
MQHSAGFLMLVTAAKNSIRELTVAQAKERLEAYPQVILLDVREDHEWSAGHAAEAIHLGRGIFERDLEQRFPDKSAEILMYCGGGFRSALTAEAAQKMGYTNVFSLAGGYKALVQAGWAMSKGV